MKPKETVAHRHSVRLPPMLLTVMRSLVVVAVAAAVTAGCVARPAPESAHIRDSSPPWDAPRDAVSYIDTAGLAQQPLNATDNQRVFTMTVTIDGSRVDIPAYIGVDRLRAVQAAVHTHDDSGTVWLEGEDTDLVTLEQFFTLWGVRFSDQCVGAACGGVNVIADGTQISDPRSLRLVTVERSLDVVAVA